MKRNFVLLTMLVCLTMQISACGKEGPGTAGGSSVPLPAGTSGSSAEPTGSKLVFHDTIEDPQGEYMDSLGGGGSHTTGTAELDLVLYETQPNVFEGCGVISRSVEIAQEAAGGSKQEYRYRTGLIRAEVGKEGSVTLTGWLTYDNKMPTMLLDAPFAVVIHKDATLRQEGLPLLLTCNGNKASLSIKMHEHAELVFSGELTAEPVESPVGRPTEPERLIYINSMWSCAYSGEADGGEYTAILLASPQEGAYSGRLSVQGTGDMLETVSEEVTCTVAPFDAAAYRAAGGQLDDRFASMSVLHTAGGTYLLLLDGEQVVLEPVGKGICFCGSMPAPSLADSLQNKAEKTRKMLSWLCRQKSSTEESLPDFSGMEDLDPNNPEDMQKLMDMSKELEAMSADQGAPAWYPEGLIPMVNFSAYDGYFTNPSPDGQLFRIYNTQYCEMEDFEDLMEPYRSVLSGYDDYKECQDYEQEAEAVFLFTMGNYTVQVFLSQSVLKMTDVSVQIF